MCLCVGGRQLAEEAVNEKVERDEERLRKGEVRELQRY